MRHDLAKLLEPYKPPKTSNDPLWTRPLSLTLSEIRLLHGLCRAYRFMCVDRWVRRFTREIDLGLEILTCPKNARPPDAPQRKLDPQNPEAVALHFWEHELSQLHMAAKALDAQNHHPHAKPLSEKLLDAWRRAMHIGPYTPSVSRWRSPPPSPSSTDDPQPSAPSAKDTDDPPTPKRKRSPSAKRTAGPRKDIVATYRKFATTAAGRLNATKSTRFARLKRDD